MLYFMCIILAIALLAYAHSEKVKARANADTRMQTLIIKFQDREAAIKAAKTVQEDV